MTGNMPNTLPLVFVIQSDRALLNLTLKLWKMLERRTRVFGESDPEAAVAMIGVLTNGFHDAGPDLLIVDIKKPNIFRDALFAKLRGGRLKARTMAIFGLPHTRKRTGLAGCAQTLSLKRRKNFDKYMRMMVKIHAFWQNRRAAQCFCRRCKPQLNPT